MLVYEGARMPVFLLGGTLGRLDVRVFRRLGAVVPGQRAPKYFNARVLTCLEVAFEWMCGLPFGWRGALQFVRWVHCCLGRREHGCGGVSAQMPGSRVFGPHCHCMLGALSVRGAWGWTV